MQEAIERQEQWDNDIRNAAVKGPRPEDHFETWRSFIEEFTDEFHVRDEHGSAIEAIWKLEQGSRTCDDYSTEFKSLSLKTGYNDVALVEEYKRGLRRPLRERVYTIILLPRTLDDWIVLACQLD